MAKLTHRPNNLSVISRQRRLPYRIFVRKSIRLNRYQQLNAPFRYSIDFIFLVLVHLFRPVIEKIFPVFCQTGQNNLNMNNLTHLKRPKLSMLQVKWIIFRRESQP